MCLNISDVINIKILTNFNQQTQSYKFTSHIAAFLSVVLITEMLEICIQTSYDQNVQLILKSYLPVMYGTTFCFLFIIYTDILFSKWVSEWVIIFKQPNKQFFSYIVANTSNYMTRWWYLFCTRPMQAHWKNSHWQTCCLTQTHCPDFDQINNSTNINRTKTKL